MGVAPIVATAAGNVFTSVQDSYTPLAPLPDVTSSNLQLATNVNFDSYIKYAFNLLIAMGAVAAVFMITFGGFQYMTADAVNSKSEGLDKIKNAIYGLLLILSSYLILRTIDPRFVNIPSTLVAPLNIHPTNNINTWLNDIQLSLLSAQQGSIYKAQVNSILDEIAADKKALADYEQEKQSIYNQLNLSSDAISPDQAELRCEDGDYLSVSNEELCNKLLSILDKENSTKGEIVAKQAVGLMTVQIEKCLNTGAVSQKTSDDCTSISQGAINEQMKTAIAQLKDLGQPDAANRVIDYSRYAGTMVAINNELATLNTSPYFSELVNTITTFNTDFFTAAGAIVGGTNGGAKGAVGGAVGGLVVAQGLNQTMTNELNAQNSAQVKKVISNIQDLVSSAKIQNSDINTILQKQSQSIINQLGDK